MSNLQYILGDQGQIILEAHYPPLPLVLIERESGIVLKNQVGCVSCLQEEARGWFLPVEWPKTRPWEDCNPSWHEDVLMRDLTHACPILEDITITSCIEAWVRFSARLGYEYVTGVVTWENCD